MPKRVVVTAKYKGDAPAIFRSALDFRELQDAMTGLAEYEGLPEEPVREGETYTVDVTILGLLKTRNYQMHLERLDFENCVLQSREKGGVIKRWDHNLSLRQEGQFAIWTDDIIVDAGLQTFGAARFGLYVYRRRHKQRKALAITSSLANA